MGFLGFLGTPLGWIMKFLYSFISNYGLVLVLFTIIIRAALFPLNVKQQKSSAKMALFQPKLQKLQKQYGKNKQRYQEEMMKLYEEEGYNPMASCLPMLLQMLVLFGIIDVVYYPIRHLLGIPREVISEATKALTEAGVKLTSGAELLIVNIIQGHSKVANPDIFNGIFSPDQLEKISNFDLNFLGFNMGVNPEFSWPTILIPIISGLTSIGVTILTFKQQKKNGMMNDAQAGMGMMKGMMYIMPIFSTWIAFSLPIGVGIYWIVGNVLSFIQSLILYKVYSPEKLKEKLAIEAEKNKKKKKKPSAYQKALAAAREQQALKEGKPVSKDNENKEEDSQEDLTASQRIALARKRMAEKYGDE